jgi:hypothetical protein
MKRNAVRLASLLIPCLLLPATSLAAGYKNFKVAVYTRAYEVVQMKDPAWLEKNWAIITKNLKVDKIYLELHRDGVIPDQDTLDKAKAFFKSKGVETAAGIATVVNERNNFETFVYTNPEHRKRIQDMCEYAAKNFDELIVDDFFFTSGKADSDIAAKGSKTWTRFRLDLMTEVSKNLVVGPAKKINPKMKVVIKYPNWYADYHYSGYNLETEPKIFDGVYTGTETRDPAGNQHLQQYLGYGLERYLTNISGGRNGGGWVDTGGFTKERYAEQIQMTILGKVPEMMFFDFRQQLTAPRGVVVPDWEATVLEDLDKFVGKLGKPVGILAYRPYHSTGEAYLHDYFGMIGLPMEMTPEYPANANTIFLTETAKMDPAIVTKMKKSLTEGKKVIITSGLLRALKGKGIEEITEIEVSNEKALVRDFPGGFGGGQAPKLDFDIVIPEIRYPNNDSWDVVTTAARGNGYPLLTRSMYSKGQFMVLTIPDNYSDLYNLPASVLNRLRSNIAADLPVRMEGPSQVGLFEYDNNTFVVQNFAPANGATAAVNVLVDKKFTKLVDLVSGQEIVAPARPAAAAAGPGRGMMGGMAANTTSFQVSLPPASYRAFVAQ